MFEHRENKEKYSSDEQNQQSIVKENRIDHNEEDEGKSFEMNSEYKKEIDHNIESHEKYNENKEKFDEESVSKDHEKYSARMDRKAKESRYKHHLTKSEEREKIEDDEKLGENNEFLENQDAPHDSLSAEDSQ